MTSEVVRVELLGPLQMRVRGELAPTGGPKLRAIVAMLGLAGGRTVSVEELLDGVWGENLPATARNTLQYHVGVLRKTLTAYGADGCIVTRDPGYALIADTDVSAFIDRASRASRAASAGQHLEAAALYSEALNLWSGPALADLRDFDIVESRAVALDEQRFTCLEQWAEAELNCGLGDTLIAPLQQLVSEAPTRERLWEHLMVALYRTGRQDSALSAYRSARRVLDRELGIDPSPRLVDLHQAILRHDPKLAPVRASRQAGPTYDPDRTGPLATPGHHGPTGGTWRRSAGPDRRACGVGQARGLGPRRVRRAGLASTRPD